MGMPIPPPASSAAEGPEQGCDDAMAPQVPSSAAVAGVSSSSSVACPVSLSTSAGDPVGRSKFTNWGKEVSAGASPSIAGTSCMIHVPETLVAIAGPVHFAKLLQTLKHKVAWVHTGQLANFVGRAGGRAEKVKILVVGSTDDCHLSPEGFVARALGGHLVALDRFLGHVLEGKPAQSVAFHAAKQRGLQLYLSKAVPSNMASAIRAVADARGWKLAPHIHDLTPLYTEYVESKGPKSRPWTSIRAVTDLADLPTKRKKYDEEFPKLYISIAQLVQEISLADRGARLPRITTT